MQEEGKDIYPVQVADSGMKTVAGSAYENLLKMKTAASP